MTREVEEELNVLNEGKRCPLRERRTCPRFPDEECILLTDEGEPENFKEVKRDPTAESG